MIMSNAEGNDKTIFAIAEQMKDLANIHFNGKDYSTAVEYYSKAILLNPCNATYFGNRSLANLRLECFKTALDDATKAIELDANYTKGYYRRATALMSLGKFKSALSELENLIKRNPDNKEAISKFNECNKIVKQLAFERAISVDDETKCKSTLDSIDPGKIIVDEDYRGPKLENEKVTLPFIKDLLDMYKKSQGKLDKKYAYIILKQAKELFEQQMSLVDVKIEENEKFTVCGDIHGQFFDLMTIFEMNGLPSEENSYLFNGDFVDRGSFSVECIFTLLSFKLLYPDNFFMSRGNHEAIAMNQMYGFEGEVKSKYSARMVEAFNELYEWLPLAHCLNGRVLVMHGGLFKEDNVTLEDIRHIRRNRQPPDEGLMCDLLWSDPMPANGKASSKRGVGIQFGPDVTEAFCAQNHLDYIIRSHEVKNDGYEVAHNEKCITVFSAPNYCDTMGNSAAFITLTGKDLRPKFTVFREAPHPDIKPMCFANSLLSLFQ